MSAGGKSDRLFERALRYVPGGVNSPVRSWRSVGGHPVVLREGRGSIVTDEDGQTYLDFLGSWGPLILGHAYPAVVDAIAGRAAAGTSFGAPTALEIDLAELLVHAFPAMDMVRLVSSGTEATMSAIRLARAVTERSHLLKFTGCYHGHVDSLLVQAGSGGLTFGVPDSPGVPGELARLTLVAEFNDLAGARDVLRARGQEIAAVLVEPVAGNMGVVPPDPGFLEMLREETVRCGALLVFDEVITGFRVAWGGAQVRFGVEPDLTCLGKVIGGGMPLAAFGGRRAVMEQLAPTGPVYQAGTLSGNPVSVAAGLTTLRTLRELPDPYGRLEALGVRAQSGLEAALRATGTTGCVNRVGSMLTVFLGSERVRDLASAKRADVDQFRAFFRGMLARGIYLPPSQFETFFLSLAHSEADVDRLVGAANQVLGGG